MPLRSSQRVPYELLSALIVVLAISGVYAWVARGGVPRPGGVVGHALGVVGFVLMLCTETLYTLRKRLRFFHVGSMNAWLRCHIFTGIVGPYLVLLHSAGKTNGLAGVALLLTVVMVLSGFVGRYIYTAAPRTLDGAEIQAQELEGQIADANRQLRALGVEPLEASSAEPVGGWRQVLGRRLLRARRERHLQRAVDRLKIAHPAHAARLETLLAQRYRLQVQVQRLVGARRLLAWWHLFHIPLGAVLFTLAFIHAAAALYYSTFLK